MAIPRNLPFMILLDGIEFFLTTGFSMCLYCLLILRMLTTRRSFIDLCCLYKDFILIAKARAT